MLLQSGWSWLFLRHSVGGMAMLITAQYDIRQFVGHVGLHNDEFTLAKLVREHGAMKWGPKVAKAKWEMIGDPNKYNGHELVLKKKLPLGSCGWPYDEHVIPDARKKLICASRLGYEDLGIGVNLDLDIAVRAAYQSIVRYAMYADCRAEVDWQALPSLIKRRWSRHRAFTQRTDKTDRQKRDHLLEVIWRCETDVDEFFDDSVVFWQALFGLKDTLVRQRLEIKGKIVNFDTIERDNPMVDNPQAKNALMSRRWKAITESQTSQILLKWTAKGNFGIFVQKGSGVTIKKAVPVLRRREMTLRGISHSHLSDEDLLQERVELVPQIHYMEGSDTVLNGSLTADEVEPTRQSPNEVRATIEKYAESVPVVVQERITPDQIQLEGPVAAALADVSGPSQEVILLEPGEDGIAPVHYL